MIIRSDLLFLTSVLCSSTWAAETRSSDSGRPRGVGPEFAKFYKPNSGNTFTCISDPSLTIPFSRVNDDYCDCPDGSDEPGTAACSYLSPLSPPQADTKPNTSLALPGFYCKNKGHVPSYLRFEAVNDGKCDYDVCCDGSDEFAGVGGTKCEDRCKEIGKEFRKAEEQRMKGLRAALKRRKELAAEAAKMRKEVEIKVEDVQIKITAFEAKVKDAEDLLRETERQEKLRVVKVGAGAKGMGKMGVLVGLARGRVEELRASLEKTKKQRDAMVERISELEGILHAFKEEYNPNFNDEGVKRAVRRWEDYAARETDDGWEEAEDRDLEAIMKEDGAESGVNWTEFELDEGGIEGMEDVAALYQFTSYLPPSFRLWIDEKRAALRQLLVENGVLAPSSSASDASATKSKAVSDAKKTLSDLQRDLSNAQNDLTRTKEDLSANYGPDDIFRALKDKCISKDSGEYTYELCFMGSTKQKPKRGGADTNMGNFAGFEVEDTDEGRSVVMKYENGQHCWNGPNRSTKVVLHCSEQDEVVKVSESEKCVYRMEVGTSAICEGGNGSGSGKAGGKDEL